MPGPPWSTPRLELSVRERLKIYLDQMFREDVAEVLRDEGHDVIRASEVGQARADDKQILDTAISGGRILVTLDEHFGDWVILPLSKHPGVIRLKVVPTTSEKVLELLIPFLTRHTSKELRNHLVILTPRRSKWITTG
jgi:predicted nuclease of predicted toxin-antitoxin system